MKFTTTLLTAAYLVQGLLAVPNGGLGERIKARALQRQSHPMTGLGKDETKDVDAEHRVNAEVVYSTNWSGAVREQPPPDGNYTSVTASFTVPEPRPAGDAGTQAASAWVGIDGDTYTAAILQAGVDFYWENGQVSYAAWYEWFPDFAHDFSFTVNAGDNITVTVESYSPSNGVAVIQNQSTGQQVKQNIAAPNAEATLAGQNAEWIVEDFQSGDSMIPLVNFGNVTFTGMKAKAGSSTYGVDGATLIEMQQNGTVLTKVQTNGNSAMTVQYIG
ncbi:hypothetical protein EYZ11_011793 [Aspergillus tanneri]|uniref:Aspergillopepsin-2 n=1 Tax=Aspergillus tanneri TaxID=1220188 RepID=A0A4S3J414_9EURO|nr:uncharacterized protein ATNIH1004_010502 [Aspergillus tanneri]KAA8643728.1 hypothetical protein ATNIH1004_010502 [Aspergillus tanneri]THC88758.1 hypothetical protein EYZ11_011793 [Aspergillus tanneri]